MAQSLLQSCAEHLAASPQGRFVVLQDAPPLTRNMPPVAGSIKWSRSLFARVKQTMQRLQDVEAELLQGETGQEVTCTAGNNCWHMFEYTPLQTGHSRLLNRPCIVDLILVLTVSCHVAANPAELSCSWLICISLHRPTSPILLFCQHLSHAEAFQHTVKHQVMHSES